MKCGRVRLCACLGFASLAVLLQGCVSDGGYSQQYGGSVNPPGGEWTPGGTTGVNAQTPPSVGALRVGDLVIVNFSGVSPTPPPHEEHIREDGNITLLYNVVVPAAGKTPGELQDAIRAAYVTKYFNYLNVVVTDQRYFFVGGEVRNPSRQQYLSQMTVMRAIDTAGGLTEFAKKKKIELLRANGEMIEINYDKARRNPKLDVPVYPGDRINVPSRYLN